MFNPITKKAVKPPGKLLTISLLLFGLSGYSQQNVDSISLKKEIDSAITAIMKRHGLKNGGFAVNVISFNQQGGQTAYQITNNYYTGIKQRVFTQAKLDEIVTHIPSKFAKIKFYCTADKESVTYRNQIAQVLFNNGYKNLEWTYWGDPSCFDDITYGTLGDSVIRINICPASNVSNK